jgi:ParB family chromosome partitioning protein
MAELKTLSLSDITMVKNYRDVNPPSEKDPDVIELSQSFLKNGVLQAILVRPKKDEAGKYELIFGHRRYMGAVVAKLDGIPANIKEVPDEDILELQVTENLQRKDVHPIDEAVAFRSLIKDKGYTTDEIALRFGKKPEYVAQRLKLNELVPELQKDFKRNLMLLGHALLISRLPPSDQVAVKKYNNSEGY